MLIRIEGLRECEASASTTSTTEAAACPDTWARVDSDKGNNRWFAGGVPSIAAASNPDEARAAANEWANGVRQDPVLLAGAARYLLDREVDQAALFDGDGCATQTAVDLVAEMEMALALSRITPSEAPANGHNSGANGLQVVGAANPGITGNRSAILIEAPNGTKIWVMARCGNPVTEGPPPVPHGPTDEPTPPPGNTVPPAEGCPEPTYPRPDNRKWRWDTVICKWVKVDQTFDEQQNNNPAVQPPQDNSTSGVNTGTTPGAPATPHVPQPGPTPRPGTPAPPPTPGGYDSGSPTGSGTPGGSTTNPYGSTQGGGSQPATQNPVDTGQGGSNDAPISNPFG